MADAILALNAGSSSVKFSLFGAAEALSLLCKGEVEGLGTTPHFKAADAQGASLADEPWVDEDDAAVFGRLLGWVDGHLAQDRLCAVGHRVVHGGGDFTAPVRVDDAVVAALDKLTPLAPLHQPHSLGPIRTLMGLRPGLPQVACFDTAFHATMPAASRRFALPRAYEDEGVRRYGFHGLSYEFVAGALRREVPELAGGRVVVAHLGSGASLCAMRDGSSIDTTMGFTALDGLVMGTRCGTLDAGVVLYMLQEKGMSARDVERVLYKESGLLGVSGVSSDMRALGASADPHAQEAIELFVLRAAQLVAAMAASLGGIDGLVFTAGIGEHDAPVRAAVCARLGWMGVSCDLGANEAGRVVISDADSQVWVRAMPTDEEQVIARHTRAVMGMGVSCSG